MTNKAPKSRTSLLFLCVLSLLWPNIPFAQQTGRVDKQPLKFSDFDSWKSIQGQQVSRDGKFVGYALMPQDGDGEIIARNLTTGVEWRHNRGWRQPVPPSDPSDPSPPQATQAQSARLVRPSFSADSRYLIFIIEPNKADVIKARKEKKRPDEMPKNALGIMDLSNGQVTKTERVKSFQLPEDGAGYLAYLSEPKPDNSESAKAAAAERPTTPAGRRGRGRRDEYGSDLVLRNLTNGSERTFSDALDYSFSKDAKSLLFTVSSKREESNGVYLVAPEASEPAGLLTGKGKYTRLSWDEDQTQLAFLSNRDAAAEAQPKYKLYHWDRKASKATELVSTSVSGFRDGYVISERGSLSFSQDGSRLFFGIAPPADSEKDAELESGVEDKVVVDLWHWKDDYIQPMQKVRAEQDRNRTYRAVYHLKEKKCLQLADEAMQNVNPSANGMWATGTDNREYRILVGRDTTYDDVYLINTLDGSRKNLLKKSQYPLSWSPNGKFVAFYDGKDWNTLSIPDGKITNLTARLNQSFRREEHDSPSTPPSYGSGGWVKDDKYVLLYDKYDIWQVAPDGSAAKNLTDGVGRKEKIEFRYLRLDEDERYIDPAKPLLLSAENEATRDSGFYRDRIDSGLPEKLIMQAKNFGNPVKAKDTDVLILTASRFNEFPDILMTDLSFKQLKKVSNVGEQLNKFLWGKSELIHYRNIDGVPLSGILIKPENFDPKQKYPMIVYIYERLSQGLHQFSAPSPGHSINRSFYASNGYLILLPDIVYTIGYPGQSALKCVLPAIQSVVNQGFVNENAIGIQGHSWGGYQIAYMVTQTNRFRAAAPGALVGNMTSAYSGIRWGSGLPRQFQYERTQSRIGGSLWEYPMRFLENSPIFHANRVHTPILMLHNDNDDAVPWYQGIEYYLALRRLGKEVYMFNYNGEFHGLRRRQNQKDYARRMKEFFDHFLKGEPKPEWMEKGIPYLEREKEKEKYKTTSDGK
jgi:dipeptidyl aminopeptidase/acylaminoacyl peptidase